MRWVVALIALAGCRQVFGLESASTAEPSGDDAPTDIDAMLIDGPPPDDPIVPPGRKKTITIDQSKVTGIQFDVPVFVFLAADADLKSHAATDGSDIHFTRPNGSFLPYEIERWDPNSGDLEAWVRLDISNILPTAFDVRYAEATTPPPAPATVFSSSFDAVWHFEDTNPIVDATGVHAGNPSGGPGVVSAKLGHGLSFDGSNSKVSFTNTLLGGGASTFSAWVSVQPPANGFSSVITIGNSSANQARYLHTKFTSALGAGVFLNDQSTNTNIDNAGFKLLHWTLDNGTSKIYVDGALVGTDGSGFGNVNTSGTNGTIGASPNAVFGQNGNPLKGILDEVRIATVARSAGWIATEFANQSSPQTFYSVAAEQIVP